MVEVGGHVVHQGRTWQVVALQGQRVYLLAEDGAEKSLLLGRLFADPGFAVVGARAPEAVPQWGLFETVPPAARQRALAWLPHIREVETGLPHPAESPEPARPRPEYDPERWTLAQRDAAKAKEMTALGFTRVTPTTVQRMRLAYRKQGLWGLVDKRSTRPSNAAGRADERVVAAALEALRRQRGRSKGTVKGLRVLTGQILQEAHGPGVVALPPTSSFYRLINALADPAELPGRPARTATLPRRASSAPVVLRPGEQVQIDTTRLDIMAVLDDGSLGRPELTIAVDVATRSILAAVLRPQATKAVDAALLLAQMAVPHPARPTWPAALSLSRAQVPYQRLLSLDERLEGAAARPVIVPETIVVDRGRIYLSTGFLAACETLGVSVQPAPPRRPQSKAVVERTFGAINDLFCQHVAGHTGSNPLRRGANVEAEARWTIPQLRDFLDEWITCGWQNRPHDGLRHPALARTALTPNQMWAALIASCGYVPVPLTGADYLELLPVRWHPITERGIRIDYRTYDDDILTPHRGRRSPVTGKRGKWEVHHDPHDARQIWVRLTDGALHEIPWIHRDHIHQPFNDATWRHIHTLLDARHPDRDQHEADLADALDQLLRRTRGPASPPSGPPGPPGLPGQRRPHQAAPTPAGPAPQEQGDGTAASAPTVPAGQGGPAQPPWGESLDDLAGHNTDDDPGGAQGPAAAGAPQAAAGYGLWDAEAEAEQW